MLRYNIIVPDNLTMENLSKLLNDIVSNEIIYTGQYSSVLKALDINLKDLWKEK